MSQVKRFQEWPHNFMQPGCCYDYVPYDWEGTDTALLRKFDEWRRVHPDTLIISITGPLRVQASDGGVFLEITVLHE